MPLTQDRSFWGLTVSQFLGSFNDNIFKQLVLLLCVDHALRINADPNKFQVLAMLAFALPWVLFSGLAGFLADRTSKRTGIVLYKVLEIGITLAGMAAFWSDELAPMLIVLFCLSTHSSFFGPCKYGILPELFPPARLPLINGVFQMTTFLAIIFGVAFAGYAKEQLPGQAGLVRISLGCVVIAVAGAMAASFVRRTPIAHPQLRWHWSAVGISRETLQVLWNDRFLWKVLLLTAAFWFMGGVVQPSVNVLGKEELKLGDARTSILAACMGLGIALGCALAARWSRHQVRFGLVRAGAFGIVLMFSLLGGVAFAAQSSAAEASLLENISRLGLTGLGVSAGLFVVPLQVVLQTRPPETLKGRMIGTMNLVNWIGILGSAGCVAAFSGVRKLAATWAGLHWPSSSIFLVLAIAMLPIAIGFRPKDVEL